jgi:diguanylate cyclase (GGDEF)-like protein/PAS domain S-box-containing protein
MTWSLVPYSIFLFATAILSAGVAVIAFRRRSIPGGWAFTGGMTAITIWAFTLAMEAGTIPQATKILWSQIEYFGYPYAAPFMFLFILEYTGHKRPGPRLMALVWVIPVITTLLAWTNSLHHLVWTEFRPGDPALNILIYDHGVWWWVAVAYYYVLFAAIIWMLVQNYLHTVKPYRQQAGAMAVACIFPAITGILYSFNLNPWPGLDLSVAGCVFTALIFAWNIYRFGLLNLIPVAREALIEQLADGVIVLDNQNRILDINPAARKIAAVKSEAWIGAPAETLLVRQYGMPLAALQLHESLFEFQPTGDLNTYLELHVSFLRDHRGQVSGRLILLRDITARKQVQDELQVAYKQLQSQLVEIRDLQERLQEQAVRDSLTGLFNRRYLVDMLERELARAARETNPVSLVMIDIDHFKQVNDRFGHKAGDLVLQALSVLFTRFTRRSDIACRFGGEEFMLVLPCSTQENACKRAEELRAEFEKLSVHRDGHIIKATFSAGVAEFPRDGSTEEEILSAVDKALYCAKAAGRNCVRTA